MPITSDNHDIIIIGGGAIGLSIAYHLGAHGAGRVLLLERNQLTSGTSWHAAGIVGPLRATPAMTELATYALRLFPQLTAETGQQTGYRRTGGYWLAREEARHDEFYRIAAVGRHFGLTPVMRDAGEVAAALPLLNTDGVSLAMQVPEDGSVNPVDLCMAYARAARNHGVAIREGARVAGLLKSGRRVCGVRMEDGGEISAGCVVIAAGAWSKKLAADAGVMLPLQAVEHMYIVTEPREDFEGFPVLRDLDRGFYVKGDAGKLLIGVFEPDATCWDADGSDGDVPFLEMAERWDWFTPYMESALALIPSLADAGIQFYMNGPESFTADTRPLIGPAPDMDGIYVAAGMNSLGIMSSAGVGKMLAEWIMDGTPGTDAWEVDLARTDPLAAGEGHMKERMKEAVSAVFDLHWPYKQPAFGRGLRHSPLHDCYAGDGAYFGVTASWERPLWFAQSESEAALPYAVGAQPWWPIAMREAAVMDEGAVLVDLSPFTKIEISGADALRALDYLAAANLDRPLGRAVYTPLLNPHGGIEVDATITRHAHGDGDVFRVTTGAASRRHDIGWLRRNLAGDIHMEDVTGQSVTIGVMGAASRGILLSLDPAWQGGDFGSVSRLMIDGKACRATRLSFVGELGWEVETAPADAPAVYRALRDAGAMPMGHYALDGCRMEKGFLHWGHDIGPRMTPLEAGIGFTIDWSKDFQGKARLETQRREGFSRALTLLDVAGAPLLLHDEPVFENGRIIGFTTSGAFGPRTGKHLAYAFMEINHAEKNETREIAVEVAGVLYDATPLAKPPFDPGRKRMYA